jgi:NADPH:quinone reductase-like Zn-dependent oxidoreductase
VYIILGHELSGIVSELGSRVTDLKIGEAVFGLTDPMVPVPGRTEAEYVIARSLELAPIPISLDNVFAAGVPMGGLT